ncbi:hypothetical protein ACE6H2_010355 [Prunus campanulata]
MIYEVSSLDKKKLIELTLMLRSGCIWFTIDFYLTLNRKIDSCLLSTPSHDHLIPS